MHHCSNMRMPFPVEWTPQNFPALETAFLFDSKILVSPISAKAVAALLVRAIQAFHSAYDNFHPYKFQTLISKFDCGLIINIPQYI